MIGFLRLAVFGFVFLTIVYFLVSVYSRSVRREKLEDRWDERHGSDSDPVKRDAFIRAGMRRYDKGLRKKLIWLVYVIPLVALAVTFYLVN